MFASTTQAPRLTVQVPRIDASRTAVRVAIALALGLGVIGALVTAPGLILVAGLTAPMALLVLDGYRSPVALGDPAAIGNGQVHIATTFANFTR